MSGASVGAEDILVTGIGITSAIGQGKADFLSALLAGRHGFSHMQRPGRQHGGKTQYGQHNTAFLGAEIGPVILPDVHSAKQLHKASWCGQVAVATLAEAWQEARLSEVDSQRIGMVIGGSNVQQRTIQQAYEKHGRDPYFIRPDHAVGFMDSDLCGLCTQEFGIHGLAYTVGGASASGQLAIIQAVQAVLSGQVDVCIAMGALMDLSHFELQALRSIGAMGSSQFADRPDQACRPFDHDSDGFIYGEACAALVIERRRSAEHRAVPAYGRIAGWSIGMDGNRNPNPSFDGEVRVMRGALAMAGVAPAAIDYVNPHGTGSKIGDSIELAALRACDLGHARINTTKSLTGHGISAAGAVEVAATLLQMQAGKLHPCRNLRQPIENDFNWTGETAIQQQVRHALSLSFGFGGINTAVCISDVN